MAGEEGRGSGERKSGDAVFDRRQRREAWR